MINTPTYYLVASLLSQNGFGSLGTDIFGGEWGRCDEQILVIEGIGTPADPKELYENPSVQILVRGDKRQSCLLYTSPSPRDGLLSRMPSSA